MEWGDFHSSRVVLKETRGGLLGILCCGRDTAGKDQLNPGWAGRVEATSLGVTCAGHPGLGHLLKQREHQLSPSMAEKALGITLKTSVTPGKELLLQMRLHLEKPYFTSLQSLKTK